MKMKSWCTLKLLLKLCSLLPEAEGFLQHQIACLSKCYVVHMWGILLTRNLQMKSKGLENPCLCDPPTAIHGWAVCWECSRGVSPQLWCQVPDQFGFLPGRPAPWCEDKHRHCRYAAEIQAGMCSMFLRAAGTEQTQGLLAQSLNVTCVLPGGCSSAFGDVLFLFSWPSSKCPTVSQGLGGKK